MFKHHFSKFLNVIFWTLVFVGPIPHSALLLAQEAPTFEQWIDHLPYNTINHITRLGNRTYGATPYALLVLDDDNEISRISEINGLSASNITALAADTASQTLWIGYANGLIDVLTPAGIQPIRAIEETPSYTGLKQINDITFFAGNAYIATDFGIVEFEIDTRLASRTLLLGPNYSPSKIQSIAISPTGNILAWSPNHPDQDLLYSDLQQTNPKWTRPEPAWTINGNIDHLTYYGPTDGFLFAYNDQPSGESTIYRITPNTSTPSGASKAAYEDPFGNQNPTMMYQNILDLTTSGNTLIVVRNFNVLKRTSTSLTTHMDSLNISATPFAAGVFNPLCATHDGPTNTTYIGNRRTGLIRTRNLTENARILPNAPYSTRAYKIIPYGLGRNNSPTPQSSAYNPYRGNFGGLIVAPGALNDLWTKAFVNDGVFRYENQHWFHTPSSSFSGLTDIVDAAYSITPDADTLHYITSWGGGLIAMHTPSPTTYNTTNTGGVLKGVGGNPNDLRTGGITFDEDHNLWGVQSLVNTPLYRCTPDGIFNAFTLSPGADGVALKDIVHHNGMLFIQSRTNGIYAFKIDGELKAQLRSGQGLGNLPSNHVLSMAVDHDGELWIGTDEGLVVLYSPSNLFNGGTIDARPILFEEDGVVQKLLDQTPITSIVVDGGNRKWIGTRGAGLFLVSDDGLRTLHHFTEANSPLSSNTIISVGVDPTSGEVLISTDAGLIGFRGDATPAYQGSSAELTTYPNPVRPGYDGPVIITGIPQNGRVKITDVSGALVYESEAQGGTVQWSTTKIAGDKAPSGVYIIYAMDNMGLVTAQDKVLIVR